MTKQENYAKDLEAEIKRHCENAEPSVTLEWLVDRQKTYVGRWLGFVSLDKIQPKALVENDFFLAIIICSDRIEAQLGEVYVSPLVLRCWQDFQRIVNDIKGDFAISKAQLLEPTLDGLLAELRKK